MVFWWCVWLPLAHADGDDTTALDGEVRDAIARFYATVDGARDAASQAVGMLVFPAVVKGGIVVGAEYGEGALLVGGRTLDYYRTTAASVGLQLGAQVRTQVLLFMTTAALEGFRASRGWEIGVDASVVLATPAAGGRLDRAALREPIVGFVFSNQGLMYDLSLEGTRITRLVP
ncbi:MAG: YSC84-related protein [Gammaproteobacteria bacterium]